MQQLIRSTIESSRGTLDKILASPDLLVALEEAAQCAIKALKRGHKILLCGNGGSAADAQHIAAELVSRLNFDRPGLAAVALTTDTSALTAIGNDYGYHRVFARQLEAIGQEGDVLLAISTSGNSQNIIEALVCARERGITTIGLTGQTGGKMVPLCDIALCIPSGFTPRIQECHILFGHLFCQMIEETIFAEYNPAAASQ